MSKRICSQKQQTTRLFSFRPNWSARSTAWWWNDLLDESVQHSLQLCIHIFFIRYKWFCLLCNCINSQEVQGSFIRRRKVCVEKYICIILCLPVGGSTQWREAPLGGSTASHWFPCLIVKHCGPQPRCDQLEKRSAPTLSYKDDTNLAEAPCAPSCPALCPPACPSAEEPRQLFCLCARVNQAHRLHSRCVSGCVPLLNPPWEHTTSLPGGTSDSDVQKSTCWIMVLWKWMEADCVLAGPNTVLASELENE